MIRTATLFLFFTGLVLQAWAQGGKALADAERYYGIKSYEQAMPLFLEAIEAGAKDPIIHYKLGVCYQKSPEIAEQIKAIPYFEFALQNSSSIPVSVYYDLGEIYLKDENIPKATETFNKFKELSNKADKKALAQADRAIEMCNNALVFMSVPRNIKVTRMANTINSSFTEYNPVVSADESVMAFTALRPNTGK